MGMAEQNLVLLKSQVQLVRTERRNRESCTKGAIRSTGTSGAFQDSTKANALDHARDPVRAVRDYPDGDLSGS
jgi:hypothetical protein